MHQPNLYLSYILLKLSGCPKLTAEIGLELYSSGAMPKTQ